jgi:hypothetical protein
MKPKSKVWKYGVVLVGLIVALFIGLGYIFGYITYGFQSQNSAGVGAPKPINGWLFLVNTSQGSKLFFVTHSILPNGCYNDQYDVVLTESEIKGITQLNNVLPAKTKADLTCEAAIKDAKIALKNKLANPSYWWEHDLFSKYPVVHVGEPVILEFDPSGPLTYDIPVYSENDTIVSVIVGQNIDGKYYWALNPHGGKVMGIDFEKVSKESAISVLNQYLDRENIQGNVERDFFMVYYIKNIDTMNSILRQLNEGWI